ncbi:hypothetical protein [Clostridium thermosuccinogenes]|uniref:hypothetical protein n=1 Tax=Clostridium thermosuccinogenes TaxID=84032 RepID=UPI000CCC9BA6|nr:hypothetical protein [Pseudoclostridium thermosuccinogenes]PNT94162.1 hypothetical protein CDQ83_11985 [Pseudoclostridium thermosuccinogenes]
MKIKCILDTNEYTQKPAHWEIRQITKDLKNNIKKYQVEITLEELADRLIHGCTFKPALMNGSKNHNWVSQQIFALDFDSNMILISNVTGKKVERDESITIEEQAIRDNCRIKDNRTTIEEQLNRCKEVGIYPIFGYKTFSYSPEKQKFRLIFCSNEKITDIDQRNKIQRALMEIFDKSDEITFDPTRWFYGGKELINIDFNNRIDCNYVIDYYYKNIVQASNFNIMVKSPHNNNNIYIYNIVGGKNPNRNIIINDNIKAISNRDAKYLKHKLNHPHMTFTNNQDFCDYIFKEIDLAELLEIDNPTSFRCILHDDHNPSAGIFKNEQGYWIYNCFACQASYNLLGVIEVLGKFKSRPKAYKFIRDIFNLEILETDWQKEQKEILLENLKVLNNGELDVKCPKAYKNIKLNIKYLEKLHYIALDNLLSEEYSDENGNVVFFASTRYIAQQLGISPTRANEISNKNVLFQYHRLINRLDCKDVPEKLFKRSQAININKGNHKHITYFSIPSYNSLLYPVVEQQAKKWKENNYTMTGISREMFYRAEGKEVADWLYPQFKQVTDNNGNIVDRTTSKFSDAMTFDIVKIIYSLIKQKGYATEQEITSLLQSKYGKNRIEKQIKKSLKEILDSYEIDGCPIIKVRANKDIKNKLRIKQAGYPFILTIKL